MTKKSNSTRKALYTNILCLVICIAMLIGTTFAWFTDSVSSGRNTIKSGTLKVNLQYSTDCMNWSNVTSTTELFSKDAVWEPGHAEIAYLKVQNTGNLALKYQLFANIYDEKAGTNVDGKSFKLSQYLKVGAVETEEKYTNRENAIDDVTNPVDLNGGYEVKTDHLSGGTDSSILALVVYMPTSVGNEANYKTGTDVPTIDLGVILQATQYTKESDSFSTDYDKNAEYPYDLKRNAITSSSTSQNVVKDGNNSYKDTVIELSDGKVKVTIPASVSKNQNATSYSVSIVPNNNIPSTITVDSSSGSMVANYEITVKDQDGNAVTSNSNNIKIELNIGENCLDVVPYHSGKRITSSNYEYDSTTGILTINTKSFSPYTVVYSGLYASGSGTENDPYMIATQSQLLYGIKQGTSIKMGQRDYSTTYYALAKDLNLNSYWNAKDGYGYSTKAVVPYMYYAVLDGNNHTLTLPKNVCGFSDVRYSTIKNMNIVLNGTSGNVVTSAKFTMDSQFENVTVKGKVYVGGNTGAFVVYAYDDLTLKNCIVDATMLSSGDATSYNAVFVGYPLAGTYTFEDCVNKGSLVSGKASMFVANGSYDKKTLVINNCRNDGSIRATYKNDSYSCNYFYAVGDNDKRSVFTIILDGNTYTNNTDVKWWEASNTTLDGSGSFINGPEDKTLSMKLNSDGTFTITPATTTGDVAYYEVSVGMYATLKAGGTCREYVIETVSASDVGDSYTTELKNLSFVDETWVSNHSDAVSSEWNGYTIYTLDGTSYYSILDNTKNTLNGKVKAPEMYSVSAYDANGKLLSSAALSK